MSEVFLIQNQQALFLGKHGDWVDGKDPQSLFRTTYKDEAVNVKVEHSVRDPALRLQVVACGLGARGEPLAPVPTAPSGEIDRAGPGSFSAGDRPPQAAAGAAETAQAPNFDACRPDPID